MKQLSWTERVDRFRKRFVNKYIIIDTPRKKHDDNEVVVHVNKSRRMEVKDYAKKKRSSNRSSRSH